MSQTLKKQFFTPEEYLVLEETAQSKSEYFQGQIYALAGGSFRHNLIASNLLTALNTAVKSRACFAFGSDMRIQVPANDLYTYPDVSVICGDPQFLPRRDDTLTNPLMIGEVLSPSTMTYDQEGKFKLYKSLPSLIDYVLIDPDQIYIAYYHKLEANHWRLQTIESIADNLTLLSLDITLPLEDIYNGRYL